ncbi:MAG: GatB/YqeY domain-containing protein [Chloroflexota bacterium]
MEQTGLKKKLGDDLKQAMKAGDTVRRSVIRMLMSSINNAEIAKQSALEEGDILGVIAKDIKQHHESIDAFKKGNRPDLVAREEAELVILLSYLPQQLTRDEIINEVRQVVAAVGAQGPGDKGKVMQQLMPRMKGKADGKVINEIVTELLSK